MRLYAVSKEGVYRHEIVGIYDNAEVAIERGVEAAREEYDDYHHFDVLEFDLNVPVHDGRLLAKIARKKSSISIHMIKYDTLQS